MVGGEVAGKTAVVFFGVHRFHFLSRFSFGRGWSRGWSAIELENPPCFGKVEPWLGKKSQPVFFYHSKNGELFSKYH